MRVSLTEYRYTVEGPLEKGIHLSTGKFILSMCTSYYDSLTSKANVASEYSKDEVNTYIIAFTNTLNTKSDRTN